MSPSRRLRHAALASALATAAFLGSASSGVAIDVHPAASKQAPAKPHVHRVSLHGKAARTWKSPERFASDAALRLKVFVDGKEINPEIASDCSAFYKQTRTMVSVASCKQGPISVVMANADHHRHTVRVKYTALDLG